jgi:hypothetical protein
MTRLPIVVVTKGLSSLFLGKQSSIIVRIALSRGEVDGGCRSRERDSCGDDEGETWGQRERA